MVPRQMDGGPADDEDAVKVTEGIGGATGGAFGAGLGALLGPAGIILGGLAGAAGGWWAGREVAKAGEDADEGADEHFRRLHEERHRDRCDYDSARGFYHLGRLARRNPDFRERPFAEVEPELRRGWRDEGAGRFRRWDEVRPFVSTGYDDAPR
jgi:hypothetical protein